MSAASSFKTLELLSGPTKILVSSALAGLALSNTAHCASFHLQPYDDDVFKSYHKLDEPLLGALPAAAAAVAVHERTFKAKRPIGSPALSRIAGGRNILLTLARNEALTCVLVLHNYFEALSAEEDLADLQEREPDHVPFPVEALQAAVRRGLFNAWVDWATQVVRSLLDWAASNRLPAELSGKLVKDLRGSVQRKAQYAFYYRGIRVVKTSLLSESTLYLADFLVAASLECYRAVRVQKGPADARLRRLARRCALQAARCSTLLVTVSVANGIGSMSPFKRGFAMFALAQLSGFAANTLMFPLIERLSGGPPPPPPAAEAGTAAAQRAAARAAAAGAAGPVLVEPLMMVNAQMPPGAAGVVAAAALQAGAAAAAGVAVQAAAGGLQEGGQQQQQQQRAVVHDMGVQADEEPPVPAPQQRRPVVGGPRLPERPHRRNHGAMAPAPQAPHTPVFREPRAPSPAPDSEDTEAAAATAAALPAAGAAAVQEDTGAGPSGGASEPAAQAATAAGAEAAPAGDVQEAGPSAAQQAAAAGEAAGRQGASSSAAGAPSAALAPQGASRGSVEMDREAVAVLGESCGAERSP